MLRICQLWEVRKEEVCQRHDFIYRLHLWFVELYKLFCLICQTTCFFQVRLSQSEDCVEICILDVFVVHPVQLLLVKSSWGLAETFFIKKLDQFLTRENLMLAARIPAQQCNKVKDGFWQVALLAIILDKLQGIGIALGQLLTCFRVDNQGHVTKFWCFPA